MGIVTLEEFSSDHAYEQLAAGSYELSYTDNTHLKNGEWLKLLNVKLINPPTNQKFDKSHRHFSIIPEIPSTREPGYGHYARHLLALSFTRIGLIKPKLSSETWRKIELISRDSGIVLIPDSNSLHNGTLHWLLNVLRHSPVWIMPFVVSLTQIQERDGRLKSLVNKQDMKQYRAALNSRPLINASLGLLERYKDRCQVLELDPSLLRYMRMTGKEDEGNVLEDRLLIEGVHAVLRATRTRARQVVITSDVMLARVLEAEGIDNLFIPTPVLPDGGIVNVQYDAHARSFTGSPLSGMLWDLAHALGTVRLASSSANVELACYWPAKGPDDFRAERLLVSIDQVIGAGHEDGVADRPSDVVETQAARGAVGEGVVEKRPVAAGVNSFVGRPSNGVNSDGRIEKSVEAHRSTEVVDPESEAASRQVGEAYLPRASLLQVLRLGGSLLAEGAGPLASVVARIGEDQRPTVEIGRRALQILERIDAAHVAGSHVLIGPALNDLNAALAADDLDQASQIFEKFDPYQRVLRLFQEKGSLTRSEITDALQKATTNVINGDAAARFGRFHVLLGQAWTSGDRLMDGSASIDDQDFVKGFAASFARSAHDRLAKVSDLLPDLCSTLRLSPWRVGKRLNAALATGQLRGYVFQPAAGRPLAYKDKVVSGALDRVREEPVASDRLNIAGRPIFTIGGVTQ